MMNAISQISKTTEVVADPNANPRIQAADATQTKRAIIKTNDTKLYFLVVILSINDNIKFLENINQGFKRKISWNKYISEITTQSENNLDYLINPTFRNNSGLFVLSFKNSDNDLGEDSHGNYYLPLVKIKHFDTLINNKLVFDQLVKNKQEA